MESEEDALESNEKKKEKKRNIYIYKKNWAINLTHLLLSFPTAPLGREDKKKKKKWTKRDVENEEDA